MHITFTEMTVTYTPGAHNCITLRQHGPCTVDTLVLLFACLAAPQPASPPSGNEADLATWGGGPLNCAGLANVLVVTPTKRMFHRLQEEERDC